MLFFAPIDLQDYIANPVWKPSKVNQSIQQSNSRLARNSDFKTDDVYFNLTIKRMPLYYMINCVYPCLVLNAVILAVFFVPFNLQVSLGNRILYLVLFIVLAFRNRNPS